MIVDTSVWIDFLNGDATAHSERLARAVADGEPIAMPGVVYTEILLGLRSEREAARIGNLLDAFEWVREPDRADYAQAARLYRQCRGKGTTVRSTIDCLIAQMCLRDDRPLLARDRDFEAMARHTGLRLVTVD